MVRRWHVTYRGRESDPNGCYVEYDDHDAALQAERHAAKENYEFLLQARDFVLHAFNRLSVTYGEQKHTIRDLEAQVKAKEAAYHALMAQAVRFAEKCGVFSDGTGLDAAQFLASPAVQAWRKEQS